MGGGLILLDTHVFVWWVAQRANLSTRARKAIEKAPRRMLADISLWEIAKLVSSGRLQFDRDVERWLDAALEETQIEVIALSAAIAVRSTRIAANFHGDPADQIIAATSLVQEVPLVTADERLRASPAIRTVW